VGSAGSVIDDGVPAPRAEPEGLQLQTSQQRVAGDLGRRGVGDREQTLLHPAADRVVADPEQTPGLRNLVACGHPVTISPHLRVSP